ncbi:MAG: response regulator [Deltaproteobacteria bacterium]|nr:response regulator [Deltaproteobacteria bacterium]MCB9479314.1 response regulator [Deltaproteobacteria bacterium]MCB9488758.1 response regulator [Deltaproteobacteria bacterium]
MSLRDLNRAGRAYIFALILVGAAATFGLYLVDPTPRLEIPLFIYAALAIITARMYVKIPFTDVQFSVDTAFILTVLAIYGPLPAVATEIVARLVFGIMYTKKGNRFKIPFNMACGALSVAAAYGVFEVAFFGPAASTSSYVLPIVGMTIAYFLVNSTTVALAVCISSGENFIKFWIEKCLPSGIGFMTAGSIATLMFILHQVGGLLSFLVIVPLIALVQYTQRIYLQKEEDAVKYISHLEEVNKQLQEEMEERQRTEAEKRDLEMQLMQAQKMEAIGRLAGGIAHDFNNLLTGIIGYSDLVSESLDFESPIRPFALEIKKGAQGAANLTRQLLAFSRKQVIQPVVLNFNTLVPQFQKMLARIIGEDVTIVFEPGRGLGNVKVDAGQIEQVLVNLLVNARDAMPGGGSITIRTDNISRDGEDFAAMEVIDTGIGMSEETRARIFEPFFTTKAVGKGTGLGLATVYGVVQQNQGLIEVESEVGVGTTFRVLFKRVEEKVQVTNDESRTEHLRGHETILVVEDEDSLRHLAREILHRKGYQVIEAREGASALKIFERYGNVIDLVLTDVVMPKMSGQNLLKMMREKRDDLPVIFMSGYSEEVMGDYGVFSENVPLIQKPFTAEQLLRAVRKLLDERQAKNAVA